MMIKIRVLAEHCKPEILENGDWIDLKTMEDVKLKKGELKLISLGVSVKLPFGTEAHIVPRSSTAKRWGVLQSNGMGVIDESYCGNGDIWHFPAYAITDTIIPAGTRICQFRIVKKMSDVKIDFVDSMTDANRGGFGSTGV
jgi:dUTP pyrophosphatase